MLKILNKMILFKVIYEKNGRVNEKPIHQSVTPQSLEIVRAKMQDAWHQITGEVVNVHFLHTDRQIVRHEDMLTRIVCNRMAVTEEELRGKSKLDTIVNTRALLTFIISELLYWSPYAIGKYINHPQMSRHYLLNRKKYFSFPGFTEQYENTRFVCKNYLNTLTINEH